MLVLVIISGIVCIFTFSSGIQPYDLYDYFEGVFWAEGSLRSHALLHPSFIYYYTVPFGSNLLMAPFVKLFGISYAANEAGMLIFFLLYLISLAYLARTLFPESAQRMLFAAVSSMFVFTYAGDNLLHHLLFYGIGLVSMLAELAALIRILRKEAVWRNGIIFGICCLWASVNGVASAAVSTIPVFAACFLVLYRNGSLLERGKLRENAAILLPWPVITGAGFLVYRLLSVRAVTQHQYGQRFILDGADGVTRHALQYLFAEYLKLFYYDTKDEIFLFSAKGIYYLIKLLFAILVIAVPVYCRWKEKKRKASVREAGMTEGTTAREDEDTALLVRLSFLFVIAVCLAQFVLMTTAANRFLFNALISLFMLGAFELTRMVGREKDPRPVLAALVLVLALSARMFLIGYPAGIGSRREFEAVDSILEEHGLSRGYSTIRHWKVLELLSRGKRTDTVVIFNEEQGKYYIPRDRIYPEELEKPDTDRFFIISYEDSASDVYDAVLYKNVNVWKSGGALIYVFDTDDWDEIFTEESP